MPAIPAVSNLPNSPLALDPATGNLLPVNANAVLFASVLTLVVVELVVSLRAGRWNRRDSATSVGVGIGYLAIKVVAAGSAAVASYIWLYRHVGIFEWSWRSPLTWLAYWLIGDFAYYWIHLAEHRVSALWASHQVHHSAESLTLVTGRAHAMDRGALQALHRLVGAVAGIPADHVSGDGRVQLDHWSAATH